MRITSDTHLSYPELTLFQALEKAALAWPASPALEFYGRKISFASFREDILTCARALAALGVKAGDTVTICLPYFTPTSVLPAFLPVTTPLRSTDATALSFTA